MLNFLSVNRDFDKPPEEADVARIMFVSEHNGWQRKWSRLESEYDDLAMFVRAHRQAIDNSIAIVSTKLKQRKDCGANS